jgi:phage terminase large subunit
MSFEEAQKTRDPYKVEERIWKTHGFIPELMELYRRFPDVWTMRFLGVSVWERQKEFMRAVAKYPKVSVRSAHGVGKSYGAATIVLWFFMCYPGSRIITTAPTNRQVKEILWSQIESQHMRLKDNVSRAGECLRTMKLRDLDDPEHYAIGFTTDEPQAFQGIHAGNMLIIFDEACGIPKYIFDSASGMLTAEGNKVLLIGNPIEPNTYFHQTQTGEVPGYFKMKISAYESPNIGINKKGEYYDITPTPIPGLTGLKWINETIRTYGINSPYVVSRVFGDFPKTSEYQLIDDASIARALAKGRLLRQILKKSELGKMVLSSEEIAKLSEGAQRQ